MIHGQDVWKTSDPVLERKLRKSWQVARPTSTTGITAILSGAPGTQLRLTLRDPIGNTGQAFSSAIIETATRHSVDPGILQRQIGRLGDTPFHLEHLENQVDPHSMVPISLLNQLRREASQALIASRENPELWTLHPDPLPLASLYPSRNPDTSQAKGPSPSRPFFIPYVRDMAQLEAVAQGAFPEIYIELENPSHYRDAVARFREITASDKNRTLWVAPPRIFKTGEDWIIRKLTECGADGFLARNHEHLNSLRTFRLRADFSFNIANPITASWFLQNGNLERLTLSYDLNQQQARDLLTQTPRGTFEITLHQHMPMFHMEHCLYCAFLTTGKDFHDCGRPCDTRRVSIRDRVGMDHPLKADAGCRNTVFNARAQTGADYLHAFIEAGARAFRIEFLNETPAEVIQTLDRYEQLLHRRIDPASIWRELKLINQLGVTRGTLKA